MATTSVRNEELKQQAYRALMAALRGLPTLMHTKFVCLAMTELIEEGDHDVLRHVLAAIHRSVEKVGAL